MSSSAQVSEPLLVVGFAHGNLSGDLVRLDDSAASGTLLGELDTGDGMRGTVGVRFGRIGLCADGSWPALAEPPGFVGPRATGIFQDVMTIESPGLAFQAGFLSYSVEVSGMRRAVGKAQVDWLLSVQVGSSLEQRGAFCFGQPDGVCDDASSIGDPLGVQSFAAVPFTFGQPIGLSARADLSVIGLPDQAGSGTADFRQSFTWLGIDAVFDGDMQPVASYTLSSASGTDWRLPDTGPPPEVVPCPEPVHVGTAALLVLAAIARPGRRPDR